MNDLKVFPWAWVNPYIPDVSFGFYKEFVPEGYIAVVPLEELQKARLIIKALQKLSGHAGEGQD